MSGDPIDLSGFGFTQVDSESERSTQRVEPPKRDAPKPSPVRADASIPQATVQLNTRVSVAARTTLEEIHNRTGRSRRDILEDAIFKYKG